MSEISKRIDAAMKGHSGSISALAREIGVSEGALRTWRQGREPRVSHAIRLAKALGVPVLWLLLGTEPEEEECPNVGTAEESVFKRLLLAQQRLIEIDPELHDTYITGQYKLIKARW